MNKDELFGVVRTVLSAVGGIAVGRGWIDGETAVQLAGAGAVIITAIWSIRSKRNAASN